MGDLSHIDGLIMDVGDTIAFEHSYELNRRRSNFSEPWAKALEKAELPVENFHVHDLRHTGNTYSAESGPRSLNS
jgi:integrase